MALSILFPRQKVVIGETIINGVGEVSFDVSVSEVYVTNADVTDHPVEKGSNITDHIRARPLALTIEGIISNTPVEFLASLRFPPKRAEVGYFTLLELQKQGRLVDVLTSLDKFEKMAIESVELTRDVSSGNIAALKLQMKQVRLANSLEVEKPARARAGATPKAKAGLKTAKPPSAPSSRMGIITATLKAIVGR
jgi:hypothetical protein